jgi:hypothetical protein
MKGIIPGAWGAIAMLSRCSFAWSIEFFAVGVVNVASNLVWK